MRIGNIGRFTTIAFLLYIIVIIGLCIGKKYRVKECTADETDVEVSGCFFNAYHDILALTEKNPHIERVLYIMSPDDAIIDSNESFCNKDYIEYLVVENLPFLTWQDFKFLIKNNTSATLKAVIEYPFVFKGIDYTPTKRSTSVSPEYLYSIINLCNERGIKFQPILLPNPKGLNIEKTDACIDLLQHYVGNVLDYRKQHIPSKYIRKDGGLEKEGKEKILKAIKDNIHGIHSNEYVEMNMIEDYNAKSPLVRMIKASKKVVFVGNSITEGCDNGGYGWYEPMMIAFPDVTTARIAHGGSTSSMMALWRNDIAKENADLYIIAAGCNDIKIGNPVQGAISYIRNMNMIVDAVKKKNNDARFAFIAPWQRFPETETEVPGRLEYTKALRQWCKKNGFIYINANGYIADKISKSKYLSFYMADRTHPNSSNGIKMYCEAVINSAEE